MSKIKPEPLPVIFRLEGKEPVAFFPTIANSSTTMSCYAHLGQHGGASFGYYHLTRNAKPEDYADLLAELRGIYEKDGDTILVPRRRLTKQLRDEFTRQARRIR